MLRTIKAGGKDRPFLYSYRAIKEQSKITGTVGLENLEVGAYLGFKYGALNQEQAIDFSQADIEDWFDEDLGVVAEVSESMTEAMGQFEDLAEGKKKALAKR